MSIPTHKIRNSVLQMTIWKNTSERGTRYTHFAVGEIPDALRDEWVRDSSKLPFRSFLPCLDAAVNGR